MVKWEGRRSEREPCAALPFWWDAEVGRGRVEAGVPFILGMSKDGVIESERGTRK